MTVWSLIEAGKFSEACSQADAEYAATGSLFELRNKVLALLGLKEYEQAAAICRFFIEDQKEESDHDSVFLGVCYWRMGNQSAALRAWKDAPKPKYTDAAGGMQRHFFVYYAGVRLTDDSLIKTSLKAVRAKCKNRAAANWPGPIGHYLIGSISKEQLLSSISEQESLRARQLCQAHFYIGLKAFQGHEQEDPRAQMRQSVSQRPVSRLAPEFYLAEHEASSRS